MTNILGKLATGWLSDRPMVDSFLLHNICILLSGVSVLMIPIYDSFEFYALVLALYGFMTAFFVLKSILLVKLFGLDNLTSAFSLIQLFQGISTIFGAPLAGFIYESTGDYDICFFVAGSFFIVSSLFSFAAQILQKLKK